MNPHYPLVAKRAAHRCEYCHAPEAIFNFPFEVEHILPSFRGGGDDATNWALACRACYLRKSGHLDGLDPEMRTLIRLFNPRLDPWAEHFQLDPSTSAIVGRTPIGRATVARLGMNTPIQLAARQQWIRLGLFP